MTALAIVAGVLIWINLSVFLAFFLGAMINLADERG